MIHCGITGLGAPGPKTTINCMANYQTHHLILPGWSLIQINGAQKLGELSHIVAFSTNYLATIETTMKAESALLMSQ